MLIPVSVRILEDGVMARSLPGGNGPVEDIPNDRALDPLAMPREVALVASPHQAHEEKYRAQSQTEDNFYPCGRGGERRSGTEACEKVGDHRLFERRSFFVLLKMRRPVRQR